MTISSSLNASVAGLAANASRLSTISDNIANASTYGYKRAVTDFESMVIDSGTGRYAAGGVRVSSQRMIDQNGTLVSTTNATDLAIRGRGFLPVTSASSIAEGGSPAMKLTTTGSFRPDAEGYLTTSGGLVLLGWPANTDGTMPTYPRGSVDGLVPVRINSGQLLSDPTTEMVVAVNLPATSTMAGASGQAESLAMEYFDNLGISQSVDVTFTPTVPGTGSSNEWTMVLTDSASGGAVIGEYVLTFDDARGGGGTLLSVTDVSGGAYDSLTGRVQVNVAGGPIDIDIGMIGASGGMTQLSDTFVPLEMSKDGSPVGNLTSVEVDANGFVRAVFDTGITRTIFQIPLVDVPNPNGLESMDQQTYSVTPDSGAFFLWNAGDGPTGDIVSFAREESATDVASELTQLIQTQRAYSSNAKVIQTVDEMLQETTNIKR